MKCDGAQEPTGCNSNNAPQPTQPHLELTASQHAGRVHPLRAGATRAQFPKEVCPPPPLVLSRRGGRLRGAANCSGRGGARTARRCGPSKLPCAAHARRRRASAPPGTRSTCAGATCANGCSGHGVCVRCDTPPSIAGALAQPAGDAGVPLRVRRGLRGADCGDRECPAGCSSHGKCVGGTPASATPGGAGPTARRRRAWATARATACARTAAPPRAAGWRGAACELPACPADCSGRGECGADGRCVCDEGYGGPECAGFACPGDCGRAAAACTTARRSGSASATGWGGAACAEPACPSPGCGANGMCVNGTCFCRRGWDGPNATCSTARAAATAAATASAACDKGWAASGATRRRATAAAPRTTTASTASARASPGAPASAANVLAPHVPRRLQRSGACNDGECACFAAGRARCDAACPVVAPSPGAVPLPCAGHGECGADGKCVCSDGWRDFDCSRRACENGCSGQGTATSRGSASPSWFGADCGLPSCFRQCPATAAASSRRRGGSARPRASRRSACASRGGAASATSCRRARGRLRRHGRRHVAVWRRRVLGPRRVRRRRRLPAPPAGAAPTAQ